MQQFVDKPRLELVFEQFDTSWGDAQIDEESVIHFVKAVFSIVLSEGYVVFLKK